MGNLFSEPWVGIYLRRKADLKLASRFKRRLLGRAWAAVDPGAIEADVEDPGLRG
jgi:hypothetical protein